MTERELKVDGVYLLADNCFLHIHECESNMLSL